MLMRLALIEGQLALASCRWWARRRSMASRLRRFPVMVGNSGSVGTPGRSSSQAFRTAVTVVRSGVWSFLTAFADRVHVGSCAQGDVLAGEPGELRDAQPGLDGEGEHGVVAPPVQVAWSLAPSKASTSWSVR